MTPAASDLQARAAAVIAGLAETAKARPAPAPKAEASEERKTRGGWG